MREVIISIMVYILGRIIEGVLKKKRKQKYVQIQKKYIEETQKELQGEVKKELQENFEEENLLITIDNIPPDTTDVNLPVEMPSEEEIILITQKKSWEEEVLRYLQ